jgi:hypothetical protein
VGYRYGDEASEGLLVTGKCPQAPYCPELYPNFLF